MALATLFFGGLCKHFSLLQHLKLIGSLEKLLFQFKSHDGVEEWIVFI
jgi:hypothetical protein